MKEIRVLCCGDRNWSDTEKICDVFEEWFYGIKTDDIVIVHGGAFGADDLSAQCAFLFEMKIDVYPAQWNRYGKSAGPRRNEQMLASGIDLVLAFHDDIDNSKGTGHMVTIAREANVPVFVYRSSNHGS